MLEPGDKGLLTQTRAGLWWPESSLIKTSTCTVPSTKDRSKSTFIRTEQIYWKTHCQRAEKRLVKVNHHHNGAKILVGVLSGGRKITPLNSPYTDTG